MARALLSIYFAASIPTSSSFVAPSSALAKPAMRRTRSASVSSSSSSSSSLSAASRGQQRQTQEQEQQKRRTTGYHHPPSKVTDAHGPTPNVEPDPFPEIDIDTMPEMHYDPNNHPVAHQPWRRGDTDGCHDAITARWRLEAQDVICDAVNLVGGKVVGNEEEKARANTQKNRWNRPHSTKRKRTMVQQTLC